MAEAFDRAPACRKVAAEAPPLRSAPARRAALAIFQDVLLRYGIRDYGSPEAIWLESIFEVGCNEQTYGLFPIDADR